MKLIPILVRNNEEEPIEAIQAAVFTKQVHKGMRKMNFQETYLNQAYAWFVVALIHNKAINTLNYITIL